ncbi:hypothetical protein D8674_041726 [Pyrus ussuriensis x Pyrus communis]|uniref:RNase H type-1 domain-containing protein n=1 Tax=Pyrus ussuriensis x Pyrus communis TaxID=2448454 RepID=A0A5N5H2N3_9ROSA|nr:hypothetical protein D8674_041726 [Pyrus ussuriensis x Pyrus communis]
MNRGFANLICESNSLQIVEALRDPSTNLSYIGQLEEDIRVLVPLVIEVPFTHIHCSANMAAHRLARFGLLVEHTFDWITSPRRILINVLLEDYASSC